MQLFGVLLLVLTRGSVLSVNICPPEPNYSYAKWGNIESKLVPNPKKPECKMAFFAVAHDAPLGVQTLSLMGQNGDIVSQRFMKVEIKDRKFDSEKLSVDPGKVKFSPENQERMKRESAIIKAIYGAEESDFAGTNNFQIPLQSPTTSVYGTRRLFNGSTKGHHNGVDLKAQPGTPIQAANDGIIRLARDFFLSGKVILIDHGAGIFTNYAHLSEFEVQEGDSVKAGQVIARSGATGRISGPHLHWGARIHGVETDPLELLKVKF